MFKTWEEWIKSGMAEPPCTECRMYRPEVDIDATGRTVKACHAGDQEHDFSCFRSRSRCDQHDWFIVTPQIARIPGEVEVKCLECGAVGKVLVGGK